MGIRRVLKPSILLRRKALRSGVLGGDRKWLSVFVTMFLWGRLKSLFGFTEPQPVFIQEAEPGQRFVVAHEDTSTSRRKRRKADKKQAKKDTTAAAKAAAKQAKKDDKAAVKAAKKAA